MNLRQIRERSHRQALGAGLAVSVLVHGGVLALANLPDEWNAAAETAGQQTTEEAPQFEALEIVQLQFEAPAVAVSQAPAPSRAERPAPSEEPAVASTNVIRIALAGSMRPDFSARLDHSDWLVQPIALASDDDGGEASDESDKGRSKKSGGRSFWDGLTVVIGGGYCPSRGGGVINWY